ALGVVLAHDLFEVVRRSKATLAALHVDDRAERALIRAAAAEIDAGELTGSSLHVLARKKRRRLTIQRRQLVHMVVERLERPAPRIAQPFVGAAFLGFSRKK